MFRNTSTFSIATLLVFLLLQVTVPAQDEGASDEKVFQQTVRPLLKKLCFRCHNVDEMESGIRVDVLDGKLDQRRLFLWRDIRKQLFEEAMPPEDELQPTENERKFLVDWIEEAIQRARSRKAKKNGSVRRLTVAQYRNTLRDLLGIDDDLTDVLPPDAVSKDGFLNNTQTMILSPLLLEAYFDIAEKALDLSIVDENSKPSIQNFRVDLGKAINKEPCPDKLILGANSLLLANEDFVVRQLTAQKPFEFEPFFMRTKYRFNEGYQGNATVRGWREYDSIYHSVFACMRGNGGNYPKGLAYQTIPEGLLLRPAIPSAEMFGVESTYGPKANFKISLRELPDSGKFRVTVRAAKYDDGLLLDPKTQSEPEGHANAVTVRDLSQPREIEIRQEGIYQADVYLGAASSVKPDSSKLDEGLIASFALDGDATGKGAKDFQGGLSDGAKFVDSPFGTKAVLFDGKSGSVTVPRDESMNVGEGDFSVAAWIHPRGLRQGGFVCLGRYNYTHGWYFDMPSGNGILRIETMDPNNQKNGTVQSAPGAITNNQWQHVAAVVRRGDKKTKLYVNGFEVASGTIKPANLDNPTTTLHLGRIEGANLFKGEMDDVRIYRRALGLAEIKALVEPGKQFVQPPPSEKRKPLTLTLNDRQFTGQRLQEAFLAVRLPAGPLKVAAKYEGKAAVDRIVFTPLDLKSDIGGKFALFEKRVPRVGVHVGLRRDCGSTMAPVGSPLNVSGTNLSEYIFEDAISNYPSPDVQKENDNYLAGVREIGVRSEYTDGREMPRLLIRSVEFEGPFYETWPPKTHRSIFFDSDLLPDSDDYAKAVIGTFASRAFRRPVTKDEARSLFDVFQSSRKDGRTFQQSVQDALLVVLTSPQFLFLIENSATPDAEQLDSFELASKLSYFLWNSAPDWELLTHATDGTLEESLDEQIDRMVADPKFSRFTNEFVSQWLQLDKFDVVEIDRKHHGRLTRDARIELRKEPIQFVQHLVQMNLPIRNLIQSDFLVANEVVAHYYDLALLTEKGFAFEPVRHGRKELGGVLTQAAIMSGLSNGRESNPVKRGAWLARKIIAEPPDDPPPNVPALPEDDDSKLTLREKIEKHRNQDGCKKCHAGIDPWGLPFEQYDAGGLFKKQPVDARSTLPDQTEVSGVNELKSYLAEDRIDQVAFSFLKHLAAYATGRELTYNEIEFLKEKGVELKAREYPAREMVRFVVKSPLFLEK